MSLERGAGLEKLNDDKTELTRPTTLNHAPADPPDHTPSQYAAFYVDYDNGQSVCLGSGVIRERTAEEMIAQAAEEAAAGAGLWPLRSP